MLKGLNKQIVELSNMDHPYFERAIFIVRAEKAYLTDSEKRYAAKRYLKSAGESTGVPANRCRRILYGAIKLSGAAAVGAAIAAMSVRL